MLLYIPQAFLTYSPNSQIGFKVYAAVWSRLVRNKLCWPQSTCWWASGEPVSTKCDEIALRPWLGSTDRVTDRNLKSVKLFLRYWTPAPWRHKQWGWLRPKAREVWEVQIKCELNFLKRLFSRYSEVNGFLRGHLKGDLEGKHLWK